MLNKRFESMVLGVLFLLALASSVNATENQLLGVWKGAIGTSKVVACFDGVAPGERAGSYFYTRYKTPIPLNYHEVSEVFKYPGKPLIHLDADTWDERGNDDSIGIWSMGSPDSGRLMGTWHRPGDKKSLTIYLELESNSNNSNACETDSYFDQIDKQKREKIETFNGKSYRVIQSGDSVTLELLTPGGVSTLVNKNLRSVLAQYPVNGTKLKDLIFKQRKKIATGKGQDIDGILAVPVYWTSKWITINFSRWYAGTGRSGITNEYRTWNIKTGEEVNLWSWLDARWSRADGGGPTRNLLSRFYTNTELAECSGGGNWHMTLEKTGIRFWQEPIGNECELDFLILYGNISPFLSPSGRVAMRSGDF